MLSGVYMHFVRLREQREPSDPGNTSKLYSRGTSFIKSKRVFYLIVIFFNNVVSPILIVVAEIVMTADAHAGVRIPRGFFLCYTIITATVPICFCL